MFFFIRWGRKHSAQHRGYVADFCPICREIHPHLIMSLGISSHLYDVPLGAQEVHGHERVCMHCSIPWETHGMIYAAFRKRPDCSLEQLAQETFPNLAQARAPELAANRRLTENTLDPAERHSMLEGYLTHFGRITEKLFAGSAEITGRGLYGCLATFVVSILLLIAAGGLIDTSIKGFQWAALGIVLFSLIGYVSSFIQILGERMRKFRKKFLPPLVNALKPLQPTREELQTVLQKLGQSGYSMGKKLKVDALWQALQSP